MNRISILMPKAFAGNGEFFTRDAGLLVRGLVDIGIDSKVILLAPAQEDDEASVIRASLEDLQSPSWWHQQNLEGLLVYTWGQPRYADMVRAAKQAGITVAQMTDSSGILSPVPDWKSHLLAESAHFWYEPRWKQCLRTLAKIPYTHTLRLIRRDLAIARSIVAGHYFLSATPPASTRFRNFVKRFLGNEASEKVRFVPIPVNYHFLFGESDKKWNEVISVGRWDNLQKRTPLLIKTISLTLQHNSEIEFRIFGRISTEMEAWHQGLSPAQRKRVNLEGVVNNARLAEAYRRAKVMLVSSAYEGCHNSSAEAVCSGATVVGCRSPFLEAIEWHTSKDSGRLAESSSPESLSAALMDELEAWASGLRDPIAISREWSHILHPDRVARRIQDLFGDTTKFHSTHSPQL